MPRSDRVQIRYNPQGLVVADQKSEEATQTALKENELVSAWLVPEAKRCIVSGGNANGQKRLAQPRPVYEVSYKTGSWRGADRLRWTKRLIRAKSGGLAWRIIRKRI